MTSLLSSTTAPTMPTVEHAALSGSGALVSEREAAIQERLRVLHVRRWHEVPNGYETREVLDGAYRNRSGVMRTHTVAVAADGLELYHLCTVANLADAHANPPGIAEPPTCAKCLRRDPRFGGTDKAALERHATRRIAECCALARDSR